MDVGLEGRKKIIEHVVIIEVAQAEIGRIERLK